MLCAYSRWLRANEFAPSHFHGARFWLCALDDYHSTSSLIHPLHHICFMWHASIDYEMNSKLCNLNLPISTLVSAQYLMALALQGFLPRFSWGQSLVPNSGWGQGLHCPRDALRISCKHRSGQRSTNPIWCGSAGPFTAYSPCWSYWCWACVRAPVHSGRVIDRQRRHHQWWRCRKTCWTSQQAVQELWLRKIMNGTVQMAALVMSKKLASANLNATIVTLICLHSSATASPINCWYEQGSNCSALVSVLICSCLYITILGLSVWPRDRRMAIQSKAQKIVWRQEMMEHWLTQIDLIFFVLVFQWRKIVKRQTVGRVSSWCIECNSYY